MGVVSIEAFDWYFLPPLRKLDAATGFILGLFLTMSVLVGALATRAGRRATMSEEARGLLGDEHAALRRVATLVPAHGVGGADPSRGSGIIGLKDRVEALGGTISVVSPPGEGTSPDVRLPGRPNAAPRPEPSALGGRDVRSAP